MTDTDVDPLIGRALAADGLATTLAGFGAARRPPLMPRTSV
jgi:hypothetical protein